MNKSASNSMLKCLIDRLFLSKLLEINQVNSSGLLHSLALNDEDIADSIWLALQMGVVDQPLKLITSEQETNIKIIDDKEVESIATSPLEKDVVNVYTNDQKKNLTNQKQEQTIPTAGFPFQVPAAPTIQNSLEIGRAMRPLKLKFPSTTKVILDEEATVTRIVERNIWVPVTKPKPERWLNLELIVEESRSSFIWQEMIDEFQKILENHGAFASVRMWTIKSQSQQPDNSKSSNLILTRHRKQSNLEQRQHKHRELIHPNKRGLTLLISDCVSPLWHNKTIYEWLKDWSEGQPTAIVQLFPERLWDSTQLSLGRKLFANALNPGVTNPKLILENLPIWLPINWHDTLVLPVLNLEPQILKLWARVIASFGNASISTYLFDLTFIKEIELQAKEDNNKSAAQISTEEQAEIIVKRFLATASLTAQRLAGMMAAAPVDMSVVNLIRKSCLHEAQPVHIAEVYMGGLLHVIEKDTQGKARVYDFLPGVRKKLNQAMPINETEGILDAISQYIGDKLDKSIHSFTALIASLPEYSEIDQEKVLPFAQIAVDVFRNIGGEYADLAEKVSENIQRIPSPLDKLEEPLEPVLEIFDFEVAFIEILKTQTFNFVVATLERQSKRRILGLFGEQTSWVIKSQQKQGIGIIEELSEGVNLELIKIPEGTFLMGSPEDEPERSSSESPQHQVTVQSFLMGKYAVTQAQWQVVASLPQVNRELNPNLSEFKGVNRPVERVSWYDALEFCDRLSQHTGKSYRLPTEAEWEYACRAGTTTPFHFGETMTSELANYNADYTYGAGVKGTYRGKTTEVGSFGVANAFGLYDMHGNVLEWCLDDWHDNYERAPTDGSAWLNFYNDNLSQNKKNAVLRGGSWISSPDFCRSASRFNVDRAERVSINNVVGFRVVCAVGRTLK